MLNYTELLEEIDWNKVIPFKAATLDDLAVLSAPSACSHNWNCDKFEIDNVPVEEVKKELDKLKIDSISSLMKYLQQSSENFIYKDYYSFCKCKAEGEYPEIKTEEGKKYFELCMSYALRFVNMVKGNSFFAWDCCDIISTVRMACTCDIVSRDVAEDILKPVYKMVERFTSVEDYAYSFICGGAYHCFKDTCLNSEETYDKDADRWYFFVSKLLNKIAKDQNYWAV